MSETIEYRFLVRGGTAEDLAAVNEEPLVREFCIETDTGWFKLGQGDVAYRDLDYVGCGFISPGVKASLQSGDYLVWDASAQHWVIATPALVPEYGRLTGVIDGGGIPIPVNTYVDVYCDYDCTLLEWTLLCRGGPGSMTVEIWADAYLNFPPDVADKITASAPIAIVTATKGTSSVLTGWTLNHTAGRVFRFVVTANTNLTHATIVVKTLKT